MDWHLWYLPELWEGHSQERQEVEEPEMIEKYTMDADERPILEAAGFAVLGIPCEFRLIADEKGCFFSVIALAKGRPDQRLERAER